VAVGKPDRRRPPGKSAPKPSTLHSRWTHSIVPKEHVAGTALALVIAIMSFLACLTIGAVSMVSNTAATWQSDISREVTIQIRPVEGVEMEASLAAASKIAESVQGVARVSVMDEAATARLLEPWLGTGLDLEELPVPRLITIELDDGARPDFSRLRALLAESVPGASFDDHRTWVERLTTMAQATVAIGLAVLVLVVVATVLTVIFATRGAMSGNRHVIEVLHFVGAEEGYIARQFQQYFLLLGLRGAMTGGALAMVLFFLVGWWAGINVATPEGDQVTALFGTFSVGLLGYAGAFALVFAIALLTAITSRMTVFRYVGIIDRRPSED
jgi:cell division transport system permease protein